MRFYPIIKILFALCLGFFFLKLAIYHERFILYPFPQAYREGAMMTTTEALVHGRNPFDIALQPQYTNDYGIVYSLVTAPFAKIFGITMTVHRAVAAFFIFASCGLIFAVMRRLQVPILLNLSGVLLLYASLLFPATTTPTADPSSIGLFLFLCVVFVPWLCHYSWGSLLLSVILGILCYYTKPYFFVSIGLIGSYVFFFVSKRKGLVYTGVFLVLFVLSIVIVNRLANCYFANCFFIHDNIRHLYMAHLIAQVKAYVHLHAGLLIAGGIAVGGLLYQRALKLSCPLYLYCGGLTLFLLLIWLGKHNGAYLWYFFHLLSPFLLIGVLSAIGRFKHWPLCAAGLIAFNLVVMTQGIDVKKMDYKDEQWLIAKKLIANNERILTTSLLTPLLIEHGREFDDSGLSEYFRMGGYRYNKRTAQFFKEDARVILQFYAYNNQLVERITNKYFDAVLITREYAPMVPAELTQHYQYVGDLDLVIPNGGARYQVTVLKPN